jgi:hypothetical protein
MECAPFGGATERLDVGGEVLAYSNTTQVCVRFEAEPFLEVHAKSRI